MVFFKSSKSPKNIEKRVINVVLEKNKYIVVKKGFIQIAYIIIVKGGFM